MADNAKILLARPHAFIVAEMRPLLERCGFDPAPLTDLSDLASEVARGAVGAVISTALSSPMPESVADVFAALRRQAPRMPVIFAGLADFDSARRGLENIVRVATPDAAVLPIDATTAAHAGLGRADVFLYMRKHDITSDADLANTERALRRHFA